jgi:hypothetical protein
VAGRTLSSISELRIDPLQANWVNVPPLVNFLSTQVVKLTAFELEFGSHVSEMRLEPTAVATKDDGVPTVVEPVIVFE